MKFDGSIKVIWNEKELFICLFVRTFVVITIERRITDASG